VYKSTQPRHEQQSTCEEPRVREHTTLAPFHCLTTMQRPHSDILPFVSCPFGEPPTRSNGRANIYAAQSLSACRGLGRALICNKSIERALTLSISMGELMPSLLIMNSIYREFQQSTGIHSNLTSFPCAS
jgi:hypothetical protein